MESTLQLPVAVNTWVICTQEHPDGDFTQGNLYRVSSYRVVGNYAGVRLRDDRRQRKDFNFIVTSKNYFWNYFRLEEE